MRSTDWSFPGGESSTFLKLLGEKGFQKLSDFVHSKPTFGTCAGAILLAKQVENPHQTGLNAIDMTIRRNAYGRQIDSSIVEAVTSSGAIRWRWSSFALRALRTLVMELKCWRSAMAILCWYAKATSWQRRFIRSCRRTRRYMRSF